MSTEIGGCDPNSDRISSGKLLRSHIDPDKACLIFVGVLCDLVGRRRVLSQTRLTGKDHDIAAQSIAVQMERNVWIASNMFQRVWLGELWIWKGLETS